MQLTKRSRILLIVLVLVGVITIPIVHSAFVFDDILNAVVPKPTYSVLQGGLEGEKLAKMIEQILALKDIVDQSKASNKKAADMMKAVAAMSGNKEFIQMVDQSVDLANMNQSDWERVFRSKLLELYGKYKDKVFTPSASPAPNNAQTTAINNSISMALEKNVTGFNTPGERISYQKTVMEDFYRRLSFETSPYGISNGAIVKNQVVDNSSQAMVANNQALLMEMHKNLTDPNADQITQSTLLRMIIETNMMQIQVQNKILLQLNYINEYNLYHGMGNLKKDIDQRIEDSRRAGI